MKKQLIIAFLVLIAIGAKSQTLYTGITTYFNAAVSTQLSDGLQTKINSNGFLMAGYIPAITAGNDDVYIIKVDVDAAFNATPSEFANGYQLTTGGPNCNVSQVQETRCYGITIKETYVASSASPLVPAALWYATASAYDSGCLFSGLDAVGAISTSAFYTFPSGVTAPSKPLITESVTNPGTFFIAGSYIDGTMRRMYVLHVNAAGTILWTKLYDCGAASSVEPKAIVESPYGGGGSGLAVVGLVDLNNSVQKEGFFALLDYNNSGAVSVFNTYGDGTNSTDDYFSSICIATSSAPGSTGYVVGGYTEQNAANGRAWIMKMDPTGTVIWSTRAKPFRGPLAGDIVSVVERFSAAYGAYEYYAATTSDFGFLVLKFDNAGNYFSQTGNITNEFYYQRTSPLITQTATPVSISYADNASVNDGFHVYGTDVNTGTGDFMLAQASFNGWGGGGPFASPPCSNNYVSTYPMSTANMYTGPSTINTPAYNIVPGPQSCTNFFFSQTNITSVPSAVCEYTNQITILGSLNKTGQYTNLNEQSSLEFKIGPNPLFLSDQMKIKINSTSVVNLCLYDNIGQIIKIWHSTDLDVTDDTILIDLSGLGLSTGLYMFRIDEADNGKTNYKLLVK